MRSRASHKDFNPNPVFTLLSKIQTTIYLDASLDSSRPRLEFYLEIDLGLVKLSLSDLMVVKIMQIVKRKPKITAVLKASKLATGQKTKQTNTYPDALKNSSCFKEFETANLETPNPKMTLITLPNSRTLTGSAYNPKKTGLTFLNFVEKSSLESGLELTKTGSQINIDRKTEAYSSRSKINARN